MEPYIYGAANPVRYSDPSGLDPRCFDTPGASCRYVTQAGTTRATKNVERVGDGRSITTVTHYLPGSGETDLQLRRYEGGEQDYQEVLVGADAGQR